MCVASDFILVSVVRCFGSEFKNSFNAIMKYLQFFFSVSLSLASRKLFNGFAVCRSARSFTRSWQDGRKVISTKSWKITLNFLQYFFSSFFCPASSLDFELVFSLSSYRFLRLCRVFYVSCCYLNSFFLYFIFVDRRRCCCCCRWISWLTGCTFRGSELSATCRVFRL